MIPGNTRNMSAMWNRPTKLLIMPLAVFGSWLEEKMQLMPFWLTASLVIGLLVGLGAIAILCIRLVRWGNENAKRRLAKIEEHRELAEAKAEEQAKLAAKRTAMRSQQLAADEATRREKLSVYLDRLPQAWGQTPKFKEKAIDIFAKKNLDGLGCPHYEVGVCLAGPKLMTTSPMDRTLAVFTRPITNSASFGESCLKVR